MFAHLPTKNYTMNGRMRAYLTDQRFWKAICVDCLAKSVGRKKINMLEVRPWAVLETSGTVFPYTDRPRLVNNIYVHFMYRNQLLFYFSRMWFSSKQHSEKSWISKP